MSGIILILTINDNINDTEKYLVSEYENNSKKFTNNDINKLT